MKEAPIFEIKHNSLEDGPGIRSVIFFKGCPLDCTWCQNPEGKKQNPELWWDENKCIADGECIEVCPENAISFANPLFINRALCNKCFKCTDVCPSTALRKTGKNFSIDDIISEIIPYTSYFNSSGGGVTLSGGEATLHMNFISQLLQKLKSIGINTLLETSGYFDYKFFNDLILPYIDMIYYDIKFIDPQQHKQKCGVDNKLIISNFKRLYEQSLNQGFNIIPRTALIPDITDTIDNINSIALFYKSNSISKTILLLNNPLWLHKLDNLGINRDNYSTDHINSLYPIHKQESIRNRLKTYDVEVAFG